MKPYRTISLPVLAICMGVSAAAAAQGSLAAAQPHLDKAREAAWRPADGLNDLTHLYEDVCGPALSAAGPLTPRGPMGAFPTPVRADWYQEPAKVFDNLYWLGSWGSANRIPARDGVSTWAVKTSEGIILIDSGFDYTAQELITNGLKKLGEDPAQIKYVILSHAHNDRYFGAKYIQDTYHARVIMSEADWNVLEKSDEQADLKPKRDMVATDGMKLTLGDTTLTLYITPGHTPGTLSTLIPLKDGNQKHVGVVWGGITPGLARNGVKYFADWPETYKTWSASVIRFQAIAEAAGGDTYLTLHPVYDNAIEKIHLLQYRRPGDPNVMVSRSNLNRFFTIIKECTNAQLGRIQAPSAANH